MIDLARLVLACYLQAGLITLNALFGVALFTITAEPLARLGDNMLLLLARAGSFCNDDYPYPHDYEADLDEDVCDEDSGDYDSADWASHSYDECVEEEDSKDETTYDPDRYGRDPWSDALDYLGEE